MQTVMHQDIIPAHTFLSWSTSLETFDRYLPVFTFLCCLLPRFPPLLSCATFSTPAFSVARYDMIWYDMIYDMSCHVMSCQVISCDVTWQSRCVALHPVTWHDITQGLIRKRLKWCRMKNDIDDVMRCSLTVSACVQYLGNDPFHLYVVSPCLGDDPCLTCLTCLNLYVGFIIILLIIYNFCMLYRLVIIVYYSITFMSY